MNNIEMDQLKRDLQEFLGYSEKNLKDIGILSDKKLHSMKKDIEKVKTKRANTTDDRYSRNLIKKRVNQILPRTIPVGSGVGNKGNSPFYLQKHQVKNVPVTHGNKPRILFIADVKEWAWWIKSNFLKKHLKDEFDITVTCLLGEGCQPANQIDQKWFDLYFTYGFSYIDHFYRVPKNKKVTGVTAHRRKQVVFSKMKMAGHVHANSIMLLKELHEMGFKNAYYLPNGVDETLFKPIKPIRKEGELIVGHVGKDCPVKGQQDFILPAIKKAGVQSATNLRTWKDKIPHTEMPKIYNEMDVFMVASTEDGTPNPALEAASCGRPIISNKIGNMPEFIKDGYNGFIVPRKIDAYVEKINYFKNNRDELIRMGNNARKTVEEGWTWKYQSENYRNMFRSIFEKRDKK